MNVYKKSKLLVLDKLLGCALSMFTETRCNLCAVLYKCEFKRKTKAAKKRLYETIEISVTGDLKEIYAIEKINRQMQAELRLGWPSFYHRYGFSTHNKTQRERSFQM